MLTPVARTNGLIAEDIWDEVVVYDQSSDRIHRLNASAALVWRHADGSRTTSDLAALLAERLGLPADEALVQIALEDLARADLLATPLPVDPAAAISRRQALERLAAVAALIPVVASIVAPTPLAAQSSTTAPTGGGGGTTTPGIVPRAGTYTGVSRLESQTCNPAFFGPQFTGTCTFNTGLTQCTIGDPNGVPRVSNGSVSGNTYSGSGSGTVVTGLTGSWTHTCTWTSNSTMNATEVITLPSRGNCNGRFTTTYNLP
jgi:hypothetical protein